MHNRLPKLRKVKSWRKTAISLYFLLYGRRCVKCSEIVTFTTADLRNLSSGGCIEFVLAHRVCRKKP